MSNATDILEKSVVEITEFEQKKDTRWVSDDNGDMYPVETTAQEAIIKKVACTKWQAKFFNLLKKVKEAFEVGRYADFVFEEDFYIPSADVCFASIKKVLSAITADNISALNANNYALVKSEFKKMLAEDRAASRIRRIAEEKYAAQEAAEKATREAAKEKIRAGLPALNKSIAQNGDRFFAARTCSGKKAGEVITRTSDGKVCFIDNLRLYVPSLIFKDGKAVDVNLVETRVFSGKFLFAVLKNAEKYCVVKAICGIAE